MKKIFNMKIREKKIKIRQFYYFFVRKCKAPGFKPRWGQNYSRIQTDISTTTAPGTGGGPSRGPT